MSALPKCPECSSEYTYEDGAMYVCPNAGTNGRKMPQHRPPKVD